MNIQANIGKDLEREARGTSQLGLRLYHQRLVLSLIRRHGALPKAELARLTGLSAQAVSVIVRALEQQGLVAKGQRQRGKVGQPLTPFSLNPDGAYAIGLKLGRRSGDLMLIDLAGRQRGMRHQPYPFPSPQEFLAFAKEGIADLLKSLPRGAKARVAGLGIAAPSELWNWGDELGVPRAALEAWRGFDLTAELAKAVSFPVMPCNDATAACAAELLFGESQGVADFAYFYVGYFIGGGLVMNGALVQGKSGNAAAFGSIPVHAPSGGTEQLIRSASLHALENAVAQTGVNPRFMWNSEDDWSRIPNEIDAWLPRAAKAMAHATLSVVATTECSEVIIDGAMPDNVRQRLVQAVAAELAAMNQSGISPFALREGAIGRNARALGAASLPLFANFIIDRDVLFKERV